MPSGAPPPVQMMQLKFPTPGPSALDQLNGIANNIGPAKQGFGALSNAFGGASGGPLPGEPGAAAEGPVAPGGVSALPGTPGSASFGPAAPAQPAAAPGALNAIRSLLGGMSQGQTPNLSQAPGQPPVQAPLLQALRGLAPDQILNMLKGVSQPAAPDASTAGLPGSAALDGAGLMQQPPMMPLNYGG